MRTMTTSVLALAAGAAVSAPALAQTADLSYKWREGVTLVYEVKAEIEQEQASPFGNQTVQIDTVSMQTMEVTSVTRGDGVIDVTTDSMKVNGDLGGGNRIAYDSTNARDRRRGETDPTLAPFAGMVGQTYTMTLNEAGEVQELEGGAEIAALTGITEAMFEAQLEQVWHVVPGDEVEIGESWETRTVQAIPGVGDITVTLTYTFKEMDSMEGMDVAVIEVTGEAELGRGARVQGMRIEITESVVEGVINFAPDIGLIIESEVSQDLVLEVSAQGQSITQSVSSTMFIELNDVQGIDLEAPAGGEDEVEEGEEPAAEPEPASAPVDPTGSRPRGGARPGGKP